MFSDRQRTNKPARSLASLALVALSGLLVALGLVLGLTQFQALAQPAGSASVESPTAPTAAITSQIRSPNKNAYITERGSMSISGIAWEEGMDPPYLTDDPDLSLQRINESTYYVKWTSVVSANDYLLQEATDPAFGVDDIMFSDVVVNTNRLFNKVGDTGTYYYRVQAATPEVDNPSRWSNVVSVTVPWVEDDASHLSAEVGATSAVTVQVRTGPVDDIENSDWHTAEVTGTAWGGWTWSYTWSLPEAKETQYLIQSRAGEDGEEFGPEDTITVTVDNRIFFAYLPLLYRRWPPRPYSPDLETINNPNNWVEYALDWSYTDPGTEVPDPEDYTIEEADNASFSNPETYNTSGTSLAIDDDGREKHDGTYYYRVRGNNEYGPGEWSNVETTSLRVTPLTPSLKSVNKADEEASYTVRWTYDHSFPPEEPTEYVLEESTDADFTEDLQQYEIPDGLVKEFADKSQGTYYYRVRGRNGYGVGPWSNTIGPVTVESFSYFDDFSDVNSGWPSLVDDERWAFYEVDANPPTPGDGSPYPRDGDGYFIARRKSSPPRAIFGPGVAIPSSDYKIEVDTRWWEGRWYATYQILFGANESLSNYYAVRVQMNDIHNICRFSLVRVTDDGTAVLNGQWEDRRVIDCGERRYDSDTPWNHWVIRREDNWIQVHVNGTFLGEWKDSTFGANRYFGVRSTLFEGFTPSKPEFDNWSVELLD